MELEVTDRDSDTNIVRDSETNIILSLFLPSRQVYEFANVIPYVYKLNLKVFLQVV